MKKDINYSFDPYAIIFACKLGKLDKVLSILSSGHDIDLTIEDNYAFCGACEFGHLEVVKLLLTYNEVDPCAHNNHAIRYAARNGHTKVVDYLLQNCPSIDPSASDNFAIRWAIHGKHYDVVKLLADNECVMNTWDFEIELDETGLDKVDKKCCTII